MRWVSDRCVVFAKSDDLIEQFSISAYEKVIRVSNRFCSDIFHIKKAYVGNDPTVKRAITTTCVQPLFASRTLMHTVV